MHGRISSFVVGLAGTIVLVMATLVLASQHVHASQCISITRQQGQEALLNSCGSCRVVNIERQRPGMDKATNHTYTLPSGTPLPLSFRGPGRTRVSSEKPCDNTPAPQGNATADDGKDCVTFQQNPDAGTVMLNACKICRLVVVERVDARGGEKHNRYYIVANSYVPVQAQGATSARIVSDGPCPN